MEMEENPSQNPINTTKMEENPLQKLVNVMEMDEIPSLVLEPSLTSIGAIPLQHSKLGGGFKG